MIVVVCGCWFWVVGFVVFVVGLWLVGVVLLGVNWFGGG